MCFQLHPICGGWQPVPAPCILAEHRAKKRIIAECYCLLATQATAEEALRSMSVLTFEFGALRSSPTSDKTRDELLRIATVPRTPHKLCRRREGPGVNL